MRNVRDLALTRMQAEVARLAAGGKRNAEIAVELGISANTVETHLTRIYRKLGVRSRTELAAQFGSELRSGNSVGNTAH